MKFERILSFGIVVTSVLLTAGCASSLNTADSDEFSCVPGKSSPTCRTPTAIYKSTHGTPPIAETDQAVAWEKLIRTTSGEVAPAQRGAYEPKGAPSAQPSAGETSTGVIAGLNAKTLGLGPATVNGRPVREPAQVMRIWIAPWIDKNDDLHYPSYLFTEVQPRRWTFGKQEFAGRGVVVPHKDFASAGPQRPTASAVEQAPVAQAQPATPEADADGSHPPADLQLPN